jgi:hypothetical protein
MAKLGGEAAGSTTAVPLRRRSAVIAARMFTRSLAAFALLFAVSAFSTAAASAAANEAPSVDRAVKGGFQTQLNSEAKQDQPKFPGLRFAVTGMTCVQVKSTENYKCLGYYSLIYKGTTLKYKDKITAQDSGTKVAWQAHGGIPIS